MKGVHCEGAAMTTIFGLLFWDVIFQDAGGMFQTAYQRAPLDFGTPAFYHRREAAIEARLEAIMLAGDHDHDHDHDHAGHEPDRCGAGAGGCAATVAAGGRAPGSGVGGMVAEAWSVHHGEQCAGVAWDRFDRATISAIAACIGAPVVAGVCRVLAQNYRHRRGGLPDLLLWRPAPPAAPPEDGPRATKGVAAGAPSPSKPRARFVEVKSTNDKLSAKQRVWLHVLTALGADAAVCKVESYGGKET